jgi:hypothetical protein
MTPLTLMTPLNKSVPAIQDPNEIGQVIVIRNVNIVGSAIPYFINIDWTDVFSIKVGQYTKLSLNPGDHFIGVKCYGGWTPEPKLDVNKVLVEENKTLYFLISPSLSCADIKQITKDEADKRIQQSKFVPYNQND